MKKEITIMFFGDSMFNGEGVLPHQNWVNQMSEKLAEHFDKSDLKLHIYNSSVSGDTTRTALLRMPYHVKNKKPDIFITQFGMNDANVWENEGNIPRVPEDSFLVNIEEILDRAKIYSANPHKSYQVLLNNPPSNKNQEYCERLWQYNDGLRELAAMRFPRIGIPSEHKEDFIDIESYILNLDSPEEDWDTWDNLEEGEIELYADEEEYTVESYSILAANAAKRFLLPDRIHLNNRGHALYSRLISEELINILEHF